MSTAKKRPNLSALSALSSRAEPAQTQNTPADPPKIAQEGPKSKSGRAGAATSKQPPSRQNTAFVGGHFPQEVRKQLRQLAVAEDKTTQQLVGEALNHLFAAYGKAEIAPTERG